MNSVTNGTRLTGTLICGRAYGSLLRKHVFCHNCIRADLGVVANSNISQNFCPSTNIHMATDDRQSFPCAGSDRNLLKNETINSNDGVRMYHDAVGVWNEQPAPDTTIKRNICARDDAPEPMPQNNYLTKRSADRSRPLLPVLIAPDRAQQLPAWIPELAGFFSCPIRNFRANGLKIFQRVSHKVAKTAVRFLKFVRS